MSSLTDRIIARLEMMVAKAIIKAVTDTDEIQLVKLSALADEVQDDVERIQTYGLSASPPVGSEAVVLFLNGNRDHGLVIACDSGEHRPKALKSGEVVLYSKHGQSVLLKEDGTLVITGATDIQLNGDADFAVAFNDLKTGFDKLVSDFNAHIHKLVPPTPPATAPVISEPPQVASTASVDAAKVTTVKVP